MPKLLFVEDNEVNRDMLSSRLRLRGYEVIFALHGAEGVSKTLAEKPDLVLMEMNLPVMDGCVATRQLKTNPETNNIPVIALTAHAMKGEREKALSAGCDEYETKPINLPRLLEKIEILLKKTKFQKQEFAGIPQDRRIQRALLVLLRHELCTPIHVIVDYSEMLLDKLKSQPDSTLFSDLEKIQVCGTQLLTLASVILNPVQLEGSKPSPDYLWNIDTFGSTIRLQLLTPLITVIGYCEMLLEESDAELIPTLDRINAAAQHLLRMINDIANLVEQQLHVIDAEQLSTDETTQTDYFQQLKAEVENLQFQDDEQQSLLPTVLLVEGNETNRHLQRSGYEVTNPQPLISETQVPQGYEQKLQDEQKITVNTHQQYLLNQNPRQNSNTSIGVPRGGKYKEVQLLLFKATIVVAGAIASVSLSYYAHNQWQADQSAKAALESTKISKEQKKYEECVNQAKAVPQKSRFYTDAQNQLNECQRLVQDEKWLAQAEELAKKNNFKDAIAAANKIPLNSSLHKEAAQVISEWTERNNNEKYLKEAQNALEEGKWQEAINKVNQVRLLGQRVKRDTLYWQNKMKPVIEEAQNLIAASNTQKSGTNNAAKQNPNRRIVRAQPPRRIVRAQPPKRIVRAQPPKRIIRAQPPKRTGWIQKRL